MSMTKIQITNTELYGMPGYAWNMFNRRIRDKRVEQTPIQKTIALCLTYDTEIYDYRDWGGTDLLEEEDIDAIDTRDWFHGHLDFFDFCETNDIDIDELAQALITVNMPEFAENLNKAAKSRQDDICHEADVWYVDNADDLLDAIQVYWRSKFDEIFEIVDENYTMRPPKDGFWVGMFIVAIFFILMLIAGTTNPDGPPVLLMSICASGLVLTGLILALYAIRWKISVIKDVITVCSPFRAKRIIRFDELSFAHTHRKGVIIYAQGKRLFLVSKAIPGFAYTMFVAQLNMAEKIVDKQTAGFIVRQPKPTIIAGFIWPLISVWVLIWVLQRQMNPANIYEKAFFSAAVLASFWYLAHCLLWKVSVLENSIKVRSSFGLETEYQITDITKVEVTKQKMTVSVNGKKAFKVAITCDAYQDLRKKLQNADIPV